MPWQNRACTNRPERAGPSGQSSPKPCSAPGFRPCLGDRGLGPPIHYRRELYSLWASGVPKLVGYFTYWTVWTGGSFVCIETIAGYWPGNCVRSMIKPRGSAVTFATLSSIGEEEQPPEVRNEKAVS